MMAIRTEKKILPTLFINNPNRRHTVTLNRCCRFCTPFVDGKCQLNFSINTKVFAGKTQIMSDHRPADLTDAKGAIGIVRSENAQG